jgi:hypothetical protein
MLIEGWVTNVKCCGLFCGHWSIISAMIKKILENIVYLVLRLVNCIMLSSLTIFILYWCLFFLNGMITSI